MKNEIYVIQPDQSGCERITMPLGSLLKMPMLMLSGPGPNVSFSFLVRTKLTNELNYKCEHTLCDLSMSLLGGAAGLYPSRSSYED